MNILNNFKKYGFSENEAEVYLCLLKHVDISAFQIAKITGVARTSVYHILNSLEHQGIVTSWKKNNVAYFTAESPNRLVKILEEKKELIKSIIPEILSMRGNSETNPTAKLYMGTEGMKIVWEDILETLKTEGVKELHAISHPKMFEYLPKFFPSWLREREKNNIRSYLIMTDSEETRKLSMKSDKHRETRLMPSDSPIRGTIDIYAHKIAFFSIKEDKLYSIIIDSPEISEVLRQFFISTWQLLGEKSRF
jgi:sugar-specific transcriptional regulator TrmB